LNAILTIGGAVWLSDEDGRWVGMMHPFSFRDMFGEEEYQKLLDGPRIITSYDRADAAEAEQV
jgi:hypothetical protein